MEDKLILEQEFQALQTQFNNLLNRDEATSITLVDGLVIYEPIEIGLNELELHPELEKYDRLYESVAHSEVLNQKEGNPNIGFGLDYIPVAKRPGLDFSDNGKDILMPMISLSVPIFNNNYKSRTVQNELRQEEINSQKANRRNLLESILSNALNKREASYIKHRTQLRNLKQAKDAEEILIKNYETGTIDFNDVLDVQELQLRFQLKLIEAVKDNYVQTAIINYLTNQ